MRTSLRRLVLAVSVLAAGAMTGSVRAAEADELALAERIAALADRFGGTAAAAPYKQCLYNAAGRLAEREVRFRRQRYRAAETAGDIESMLATLQEWRKLEPGNLFVQMRLVDVYVTRLQTADARLAYLKQIVDSESANAEVRSHAATQMARLYIEQSRTQQALEMVRKGMLLNGLNVEAMKLQWQLGLNGSSNVQRISLLLSILKADPSSTDAVLRVADEVGAAGMTQASLQWYAHAAAMEKPMGGLGGASAKEYAAELLIASQDRAAAEITSRLLEKDSSDPTAWFLTLLAEKNMKDRIELVRKNALIGLLNRVAEARQAIGATEATTRPLGSDEVNIPAMAGDVELLKSATPEAIAEYVAATADVAWFYAYFSNTPAGASEFIKAVATGAPAEKGLIARLEGWQLLRSGKIEEARGKLAPLADVDPMAAMGMVHVLKADPSTARDATDLARKLCQQFPSRPIGALVHLDLAELAGELPPQPSVETIRDLLDRFPREILKLASAPQEFLSMRLQPQQVGHDFAEPIIVELELRNTQGLPLVVGPSGMARDAWINVQTRGLGQRLVPGVCLENLEGPVVLAPGAAMRWTMRMDRGPLATILNQDVQQAMQMNVFGFTNAVPTETGMTAGACGVFGKMTQMLERRAASLASDTAMRKAQQTLEGTDGAAKLRLADQAAAHLSIIADPAGPASVKAMDAELRDLMIRLSLDGSMVVRSWARYRMAQMSVEPAEKTATDLAGETVWYGRLLAAISAMETPELTRRALLQRLESDPDATVRRLAAAIPQAMAKPDEPKN